MSEPDARKHIERGNNPPGRAANAFYNKSRIFINTHWPDLAVLIVYIVLSLAMCWPLPAQFGARLAGAHSDARVFQWNNWWIKQAVLALKNPMRTGAIYYPSGASLSSHNTNWVSSLIALPLDLLFGPVAAYNLTFLLTLFLAAFAMYLLVRHLTRQRGAALVAGLIFAFFPYHLSGNWDGQMNLANIQWLPLFALFCLRTVRRRRWRDAVWAGIFLALSGLDCLFFPIFAGMWALIYALYVLSFERRALDRRLFKLGGAGALVALTLLAPVMIPALADARRGSTESALNYYATEKSTDLLAFVLPSTQHPLLGRLVAPIYAGFQHWRPAFLGVTPLLLALWGLLRGRKKAVLWGAALLWFALLSLGTTLTIQGVEYTKVPMLYDILTKWIPALKIIRQASRFNIMVMFSLSVLAGLGCADLCARRHGVIAGALGAIILFEYLAWPCPTLPAEVSPFYTQLAQETGDFAILELPLDDFYSRRSLYAQTIHGAKLVNGYLARVPAHAHDFVQGNALLKKLFIRMEVDPRLIDLEREIGLLRANGIRYVVIQKQPLPPHPAVEAGVQAGWRELFGPDVFYEDADIAVYRLTAPRLPPAEAGKPVNDDLALVEVQTRRVEAAGRQWLRVDVLWSARQKMTRDYRCQLSIFDGQGIETTFDDLISPRFPTSRWTPGLLVAERYALPIPAALPPGEYRLAMTLSDGRQETAYTTSIVAPPEATSLSPALDEMQASADVTFAGRLWLIGYTAAQDGGQLKLDLYWQALRAMAVDYKMFAHLIDPNDDAIVAQSDWMPRDWSYPTSLWDRREMFIDRVVLDVGGVAPGQYRLALGVYRPGGDRLTAVDGAGREIADHRALMAQMVEVRAP